MGYGPSGTATTTIPDQNRPTTTSTGVVRDNKDWGWDDATLSSSPQTVTNSSAKMTGSGADNDFSAAPSTPAAGTDNLSISNQAVVASGTGTSNTGRTNSSTSTYMQTLNILKIGTTVPPKDGR